MPPTEEPFSPPSQASEVADFIRRWTEIASRPATELLEEGLVLRAVDAWQNSTTIPATEIFKVHGSEIFRGLPEKYWKIPSGQQTIQLYRGKVMSNAFDLYTDDAGSIPRPLTAWSTSVSYPLFHSHVAGGGGGNRDALVWTAAFTQNDVAFIPPRLSDEKEIVVGNYHPLVNPTGIIAGANNIGPALVESLQLRTGGAREVIDYIRSKLKSRIEEE